MLPVMYALLNRESQFRSVSEPSSGGMEPVKLLLLRRRVSAPREARLAGMVPLK